MRSVGGLVLSLAAVAWGRLPGWGYRSWDEGFPALFYGSNCTGFDSPGQLLQDRRHQLAIFLFPVNQRNKPTLGADCAADRHADGFGLAQADALRRAGGPPVAPYVSSLPLGLAFFDSQRPLMPVVNVTSRVSRGAEQWRGIYLQASNGTLLGPVGNTDLWFDFRNQTARDVYVQKMIMSVATRHTASFGGAAQGVTIGGGTEPGCEQQCVLSSDCVAVSRVVAGPDKGKCSLFSRLEYTNRDPRYSTELYFANRSSPASAFFFDNPDWGVCGAIRQFSNDPAVTDELLAELYDATTDTMIQVAQALNANGQLPIFAVTNGFLGDPSQGGSWPIMPGYRCPFPYERMLGRLLGSGASFMRFYEFQWPRQGGPNCDLVLRTAAKEAAAGIPLVVHGVLDPGSNATLLFQLAAFLATASSDYSYFGASSSFQDSGWQWHDEYDVKYGQAVGDLKNNGSFYYRELRNYHVHVDCTASGQGAHLIPKSDLASHRLLIAQRFEV